MHNTCNLALGSNTTFPPCLLTYIVYIYYYIYRFLMLWELVTSTATYLYLPPSFLPTCPAQAMGVDQGSGQEVKHELRQSFLKVGMYVRIFHGFQPLLTSHFVFPLRAFLINLLIQYQDLDGKHKSNEAHEQANKSNTYCLSSVSFSCSVKPYSEPDYVC